jgi:hypothetical protein
MLKVFMSVVLALSLYGSSNFAQFDKKSVNTLMIEIKGVLSKLPKRVDDITFRGPVVSEDETITIYYIVDLKKAKLSEDDLKNNKGLHKSMFLNNKRRICNNPYYNYLVQRGIEFSYIYSSRYTKNELFSHSIDREACKK